MKTKPTNIPRYTVGDCQMLPSKTGRYVEVEDAKALLDYITDDDNVDAMLLKIQEALVNLS